MRKRWRSRFSYTVIATSVVLLIYWIFCLPDPLFKRPLATVLLDREGQLLSATIAKDEQWRIPAGDSLSPKLKAAVIAFEDQRFYQHWGVDFKAIARATRQNVRAGKVVSGGSTISMQVIRLAQENPPRTLWQKAKEAFLATRLEWRYNKENILKLWCDNAPFGGNVVGIEAASWRYYGRSAETLSWAEAATLAVLPNSPALIHPGRSRDALLKKRNRLLLKLLKQGTIDEQIYELAQLEELPNKPHPLPREAPHLLQRLKKEDGPGRYLSRLDGNLQRQITASVERHQQRLSANGIYNVAAMAIEVASGDVIAYVGNSGKKATHSPSVDMITAPRSPGSLLKPLLYGLSLSKGIISPTGLLPDYPSSFRGFRPANFSDSYNGAVAADESLMRSLNIPFVYLLRDYGIPAFHEKLKKYGFKHINRSPDHYGLSLVLGGCEISMEEIAGWFTGLARQQRYYYERQGQYAPSTDWMPLNLTLADQQRTEKQRENTALQQHPGFIDAGAGYEIVQALKSLERPLEAGNWKRFDSSQEIAWKTGTSFGFRDAWAVGASPEYVVAVWTGNADGEGRQGLVGVKAAAPLLFEIFDHLPNATVNWFETPYDELSSLNICKLSGFLASPNCEAEKRFIPKHSERSKSCPYHKTILLDQDSTYQVNLDCYDQQPLPSKWFQLPTRMAHFYRNSHPEYQAIPSWHPDCPLQEDEQNPAMALIYPYSNGTISFSLDRNNQPIPAVFKLAHRYPETTVHWHLDEQYINSTTHFHNCEIIAAPGIHILTLTDSNGRRLIHRFKVE